MNRGIVQCSIFTRQLFIRLITNKRFRSRAKKNHNLPSITHSKPNPFLGTKFISIKVTKKPTETYYESTLSDADIALIGRNDFTGVKSIDEKAYRKISPENVFSKIQEHFGVNKRVHAEFYMINILTQLESKNSKLKETILRRPDYYIPLIIRCCGHVMSDLHKNKRTVLLNRAISALELNEIPLSVSAINAILTTKLENDDDFNVRETFDNIEKTRQLNFDIDIDLINLLFRQLAKNGDLKQFSKLREICVQRGLQPDRETDLAEIYLFERRGITLKSDNLIERFKTRYGDNAKFEALGVACCAAVKGKYINRLRVLLRKSVYNDPELGRYALKLPTSAVFEIIWLLAEDSADGMGKQWTPISQQILDHVVRSSGFFKSLFSEAERHINHNYFYSGIAFIEDMFRVRNNFEEQRRTKFASQIISRLANRMIASGLESTTIIDLTNRVIAFMGAEARFYDNIILAVLTYKKTTPMEKFEQFRVLVDMVDAERERIHIILPLIVSCPDLISRYKMMFRCSNIGYKNISDLNPYVMQRKIFKPFIDASKNQYSADTDYAHLQGLANSLKSYGIPLKDIWLLYFKLLKEQRMKGLETGLLDRNIASWLKDNQNQCFPKPDVSLQQRLASMDYSMLKRLVVEERNSEKVHDFLKRREFPPDTNFEEITEPILYLYIETANWGYLQRLLQLLSQYNSKSDDNPIDIYQSHVKNYHLLHILRRKLDELPSSSNISSLVEYVYELKRLFPTAIADQDTFFDTISAYRRLFNAIIQSLPNTENSSKFVEQIIELLLALVRLDVINLHTNETLTPIIIENVFNWMGWNAAVETWMRSQTSLSCSNGLLQLFRFAIKQNDSEKIAFVAHKAKMFILPSKVDAFLAAAYVLQYRQNEASQVLANAIHPVTSFDVTQTFRLTNALLHSRHRASFFPLNFMKICLEHTNLIDDDKAVQLCNDDWIRLCERVNQGSYALSFLDLYKSYGIRLSEPQLQKVRKILECHTALISKWITSSEGLLNLECLKESQPIRSIETLENKLKELLNRT